VFEKSNHFYVRYYTTVDSVRKQKAEPLCEKDDKRHSKKCKAVRLKLDEFMLKVNSREETSSDSPTVTEFWTGTYLPFAEKHLRASTVSSYKDLWQRHLKPHLGSLRLTEYRPVRATAFLTKLSESLGRNALNHVRSLMSGVFSHAAALGHVEHNPMRDAKILAKTKAPANSPHYSLAELASIMAALSDDPSAQTVMALAGFLGLRPSEITGLRWEDCSEHSLHIQRAVLSGIAGPTKTPESVAVLPLISPVAIPLAAWRKKCGDPTEGWVFQNRKGKPIDIREFCRGRIRPTLAKKGAAWKGLYAGRRTAATVLTQLTGNPIAASQLLRHRNMSVTMTAYIKADRSALAGGLKMLEAATQEGP